jgi:hypothetical protein
MGYMTARCACSRAQTRSGHPGDKLGPDEIFSPTGAGTSGGGEVLGVQ